MTSKITSKRITESQNVRHNDNKYAMTSKNTYNAIKLLHNINNYGKYIMKVRHDVKKNAMTSKVPHEVEDTS